MKPGGSQQRLRERNAVASQLNQVTNLTPAPHHDTVQMAMQAASGSAAAGSAASPPAASKPKASIALCPDAGVCMCWPQPASLLPPPSFHHPRPFDPHNSIFRGLLPPLNAHMRARDCDKEGAPGCAGGGKSKKARRGGGRAARLEDFRIHSKCRIARGHREASMTGQGYGRHCIYVARG